MRAYWLAPVSVLAAIIKHMSPNVDKIRRLVSQSSSLQHKTTVKETTTWSKVINQEGGLLILTENAQKILHVTQLQPLPEEQHKGICRTVHKCVRLLDNWSKEAKQRS